MNPAFHVLEWRGEDSFERHGPGSFDITGFGRDARGITTSVRFAHLPSFLVRPKARGTACGARLNRVLLAIRDTVGDNLHHTSGIVRGKPFTGWQDQDEPFLRLVFCTKSKMRAVGGMFRDAAVHPRLQSDCPDWFHRERLGYETFELDSDPLLQALTSLGIPPTGWVRADSAACTWRATRCDVHYNAVPVALSDEEAPKTCAPHVVATFDIEALSSRSAWKEQCFPDATVQEDAVTQICTFFSRFGASAPYDAESLVLLPAGGEAPARDTVESLVAVRVRYFRTEGALLSAWVASYAAHKVSVWCHFNGLGFDEAYLHTRCEKKNVDLSPMSLGLARNPPRLQQSALETNAFGANFFQTVDLAGVFHLDVMQDIKRNHKLESYSLDACAAHFVPGAGSKTGLAPQAQFDCFLSGKAADIDTLTTYCCQDVALTYQLMERLAILPSMIETAAISWVTPSYLVTRGLQIRVISCIKREIYARDAPLFLRDTKFDAPVEGGYKGATVLEPKRAPWFYPHAIISLDFASLYPSIMMQYNLSHETWTATPPESGDDRFYHHEEGCYFLRSSHGEGVLPAILIKLKASRKLYKRSMAHHEKLSHDASDVNTRSHHAFMEKVYNAKQNAIKVTMNSVYGVCGVASNGKQSCLPLASATTTIGRRLIDKTVAFCEDYVQGSEVIYGDTVGASRVHAIFVPDEQFSTSK
jgi:DNA polymerase delta subunit 1